MSNQGDVTVLSEKALALELSPQQIRFAHYIATPKAKRPKIAAMVDELGVSLATLYSWKVNKRVLAMTQELMRRYFVDDLADILEAMRVKAINGDTQAAKLVIDYIEDYERLKLKLNSQPQVNNIYVSKADVEIRIEALRNKID